MLHVETKTTLQLSLAMMIPNRAQKFRRSDLRTARPFLYRVIIDIIQEHHGTSLVRYFYQRALQQHEDARAGGVHL